MRVGQRLIGISGLSGAGCCLLALALAIPFVAINQAQGAKDAADDFFNQVDEIANPPDLEKLNQSHLSDLTQWQDVQPARIDPKAAVVKYAWKTEAGNIAPLGVEPATTMIAVPQDGEYRIWLRYVARPDVPQPATLTLSGPSQATHVFGGKGLQRQDGKSQEKAMPIRFEAEYQRMSTPSKPTPVWEYWDVSLKSGATQFALTSKNKEYRADRLLITQSKFFKPSLSTEANSANLSRTYYRFKVIDAGAASGGKDQEAVLGMAGGLTYHWGRPPKPGSGSSEPIWYYSFFENEALAASGKKPLKINEWSGFVDVTDPITSPGPWATASLSVRGLPKEKAKYRIQIEAAWYPHQSAVIKRVETVVSQNAAIILIPIDRQGYTCAASAPDDKTGVWGMRTQAYMKLLETTEDVNQRHMTYAKDALAALPRQGNPSPKLIKLSSGNGAAPGVREAASRMLASIGINTLAGTSPELRKELGLRDDITIHNNDALMISGTHDASDPLIEKTLNRYFESMAKSMDAKAPGTSLKVTTLKMGDEIGAIVGPQRINELPDAKKQFHDYLRQHLRLIGQDDSYFGVKDVSELEFTPRLSSDAGRFERRLYYHSSRFNFVYTARFYQRYTAAAKKHFPNIRSYCNFSPHPPMFGQSMNGSDWFALTREGGATMAWAEDWAGLFGGWGFAGIQTVSYYAALVECAARKDNLPAGFYVVTTMGGADRKMFCLVAHGIMDLELYSFGPRYAGAEFSNFWDERSAAYAEIARGAFALGPADEIIAKGTRQARKTALLYNRTHEIWNGGTGGFQSDRLLTFIALQQAHLPVDIVLEEDLTPANLKQYSVVYVQGYNLADRHVAALEAWVKEGGTLVGIAGTAMRDEYNDTSDAGTRLFGASQRYAGTSTGGYHPQAIPAHKAIDRIKVQEGVLTPAIEADVVGVKVLLTPTTAKPVATFADGSAAGVYQELGKGKTLLWGVMPGFLFKGDAPDGNHYRLDRGTLITKAATATLGRARLEVSDPLVEACLFEHPSGLAVTLNEVGLFRLMAKPSVAAADIAEPPPTAPAVPAPGANPDAGVTVQPLVVPAAAVPPPAADAPDPNAPKTITVSVQTDRVISQVMTSYCGPLAFKREGDRIVVEVPLPKTVDVLILK